MDYHIFREFADSWFLLVMFGFFIAAVVWAFRPGSTRHYGDAGQVPFRHDDAPRTTEETKP